MRFQIFALLIPAFVLNAQAPSAAEKPLGLVSQVMLKSLNGGGLMADLTVSEDSQHVALIRLEGARKVVVFDGTESQAWDDLGNFSDPEKPDLAGATMQLSATGGQLAYVARDNGRVVLVVDNKPIEILPRNYRSAGIFQFLAGGGYVMSTFDSQRGAWVVHNGAKLGPYREVQQLTVSADRKHVAFVALTGVTAAARDAAWAVVIDGKQGPQYNKIAGLQLSADGSQHVYAAEPMRKGSSSEGWVVVKDSKVSPERYQKVSDLQISADGKHHAYLGIPTLDGVNPKGGSVVVHDGKTGKEYFHIDEMKLSPDGTRTAFTAMHPVQGVGNQMNFIADGVESRDYPWYASTTVAFSPDSKNVGFISGERILYINNQELPAAGMSQGVSLATGDSGPAFVYRTKEDDNIVRVFVNGVKGPDLASADLDRLTFNPAGTVAAYFARNIANKPVLVVGSEVIPLPERASNGAEFLRADSTVLWSRDGAHYAVTGQQLIIDGKMGPTCGAGKLGHFSPDGKHFAIACPTYDPKTRVERYGIMLDGKILQTPDALVIRDPGSFRLGADNVLNVVAVIGVEARSLHFPAPADGLQGFKPESGAQVSATQGPAGTQSTQAGQNNGQQPVAPLDVQIEKAKEALQKKLPKIFGGKK